MNNKKEKLCLIVATLLVSAVFSTTGVVYAGVNENSYEILDVTGVNENSYEILENSRISVKESDTLTKTLSLKVLDANKETTVR